MWQIIGAMIADLSQSLADTFKDVYNYFVAFCIQNPFNSTQLSPIVGSAVNTITLYIQAVALAIVIFIRICVGIKDGIFANGGDLSNGETAGQWLLRSLMGITVVCIMPTLFKWVAGFSCQLGMDIAKLGSGQSGFVGIDTVLKAVITYANGDIILLCFWSVCCWVIVYYVITILFQCLKRQIQLIVLSLIASLVAITSGTKNTSDVISLMKEAVAISVVSSIQLLILQLSFAMLINITDPLMILLFIAVCSAIKQIPVWIEQYVPATSVTSNGTGKVGSLATSGLMVASRIKMLSAAR